MTSKGNNLKIKLMQLVLCLWAIAAPHSVYAQNLTQAAHTIDARVETKKIGSEHAIIVHNNTFSTLSVVCAFTKSENVYSDKSWPLYSVVPAKSNVEIAKVFVKDSHQNSSFAFNSSFVEGDLEAIHDKNAIYRLPYMDNSSFSITQSIGATRTTHTTPDSLFAVDFAMPEGTPIVAARDGLVTVVENNYTQAGYTEEFRSKANSINIQHSDGTLGVYAHLKYHGAIVSPGQLVKAGDVIGYSGNTGFSSGAHLHFALLRVQKNGNTLETVSVPFSFYIGSPPYLFEPKKGDLVLADYTHSFKSLESKKIENNLQTVEVRPMTAELSNVENPSSQLDLTNAVVIKYFSYRYYFLAVLFIWLLIVSIVKKRRKIANKKRLDELRKMFN